MFSTGQGTAGYYILGLPSTFEKYWIRSFSNPSHAERRSASSGKVEVGEYGNSHKWLKYSRARAIPRQDRTGESQVKIIHRVVLRIRKASKLLGHSAPAPVFIADEGKEEPSSTYTHIFIVIRYYQRGIIQTARCPQAREIPSKFPKEKHLFPNADATKEIESRAGDPTSSSARSQHPLTAPDSPA